MPAKMTTRRLPDSETAISPLVVQTHHRGGQAGRHGRMLLVAHDHARQTAGIAGIHPDEQGHISRQTTGLIVIPATRPLPSDRAPHPPHVARVNPLRRDRPEGAGHTNTTMTITRQRAPRTHPHGHALPGRTALKWRHDGVRDNANLYSPLTPKERELRHPGPAPGITRKHTTITTTRIAMPMPYHSEGEL